MKRNTALKLAIAALQKEHRYWHGIGYPYLSGQITERDSTYHKAAMECVDINKAIELLDGLRRQREMF